MIEVTSQYLLVLITNIIFMVWPTRSIMIEVTSPHFRESIPDTRGVCGAKRCGFKSFLALHFVMRFSKNHNYTAPHFCGQMCNAMYKMKFEQYEVSIFFKFWFSYPAQNYFFPLFLAKF